MKKVDQKYKYYLVDMGPLIIEMALEIKENYIRKKKGSPEYEFDAGQLMAYNAIIAFMQSQAEAFDIDLKEIGLDDIDPLKELIFP